MDYYISVTDKCNMRCSFCFWEKRPKNSRNETFDARTLQSFLNSYKHINHDQANIVFYGGEPLLNQQLMEEIINLLPENEFRFGLYTNGLLIRNIKQNILENLSYLIVSIDGDQNNNDKYRGKGTFEIVYKNILDINKKFNGETIARLTLTNESDLLRSIKPIIDCFDHFFWQFESTNVNHNAQEIQEKYAHDVELLLDYWLLKMRQGVIYNFIPFQSITSSIIYHQKVNSLRCGCGTSFIYINTDGNCYSCDELVGYKKFHIGDINNGINYTADYLYRNAIPYCSVCEIKDICGGRCIATFIKYSHDRWKFYCAVTKILISKIQKKAPALKQIIREKGISYDSIGTFLTTHIFEGIP